MILDFNEKELNEKPHEKIQTISVVSKEYFYNKPHG